MLHCKFGFIRQFYFSKWLMRQVLKFIILQIKIILEMHSKEFVKIYLFKHSVLSCSKNQYNSFIICNVSCCCWWCILLYRLLNKDTYLKKNYKDDTTNETKINRHWSGCYKISGTYYKMYSSNSAKVCCHYRDSVFEKILKQQYYFKHKLILKSGSNQSLKNLIKC